MKEKRVWISRDKGGEIWVWDKSPVMGEDGETFISSRDTCSHGGQPIRHWDIVIPGQCREFRLVPVTGKKGRKTR